MLRHHAELDAKLSKKTFVYLGLDLWKPNIIPQRKFSIQSIKIKWANICTLWKNFLQGYKTSRSLWRKYQENENLVSTYSPIQEE